MGKSKILVVLLVLVQLVFISVAMAAEAVTGTPTTRWLTPENTTYLLQIILAIITLVSPFILKGFISLIGLAKSKSQNELVHQILGRIEAMAPAVVKSVYDEYVKAIADASKDGSLTPDEIKEAQNRATKKLLEVLGKDAIGTLTNSGINLEKYLPGVIGLAVEQAKQMFQIPQANGGDK